MLPCDYHLIFLSFCQCFLKIINSKILFKIIVKVAGVQFLKLTLRKNQNTFDSIQWPFVYRPEIYSLNFSLLSSKSLSLWPERLERYSNLVDDQKESSLILSHLESKGSYKYYSLMDHFESVSSLFSWAPRILFLVHS